MREATFWKILFGMSIVAWIVDAVAKLFGA